jgi:hypothetical protein
MRDVFEDSRERMKLFDLVLARDDGLQCNREFGGLGAIERSQFNAFIIYLRIHLKRAWTCHKPEGARERALRFTGRRESDIEYLAVLRLGQSSLIES